MQNAESTPLTSTLAAARARLLERWTERGSFRGLLSPSALSTATATIALVLSARAAATRGHRREDHEQLAAAGHAWLCGHQNEDGGWGDTIDSPSNISTTTVVWACLGVVGDPGAGAPAASSAEEWLRHACGGELVPDALARAIRARYGRDHTFSVPILMTCALGGRLGDDGWRWVPALPFELAACPYAWFRWLRLRTVSYALPALIGIGQARHHHRPSRNPAARLLRSLTRKRTLRLLAEIQPSSGGYLEAAPLTSFVSMALISSGLSEHVVVERGLGFLAATARDDGSWPIDTNLDTWTTSLSVNALAGSGALEARPERLAATRAWLLDQHHFEEHPYTRAAPGGWAWTDLAGGVPDADDTAGALLALHALGGEEPGVREAAQQGVAWLTDLQNGDGGIPTFCRGWGKLPFDRSSPDLTAHALRAWAVWRPGLAAAAAAVRYLIDVQRSDGAWVPLWFGNQHQSEEENPLHGTSRVLRAVAAVRCEGAELDRTWLEAGRRGVDWMLAAQRPDGGFGADAEVEASVEETALAIEALAEWEKGRGADQRVRSAVERGVAWLVEKTDGGKRFDATPIGLYFAKLWYSEELYPVVFTVSALERAKM